MSHVPPPEPLPPGPLLDGDYHLRPLRLADVAAWYALLTDPRVYGPTSWDLRSAEQVATMVRGHQSSGLRWAVARAEDDTLVGTCGATRWDPTMGVAEVAYELAPAVWGRGLASAAVRAFLAAARSRGLRRVEAHTWCENVASGRVLSRCGFTREEHLPAFRLCRGEPRDFWRWGIFLDGARSGGRLDRSPG